jgi:hypothetical protein
MIDTLSNLILNKLFNIDAFAELYKYDTGGKWFEWEGNPDTNEIGELWALGRFHITISRCA